MYSLFQKNVNLAAFTTLRIGGPAKYLIEIRDASLLAKTIAFCTHEKLPYMVLGNGSNVLFSDDGFDGLVIVNKISFLRELSNTLVHVGAGYSFSLLGTQTAKKQLANLEFAAGIPGTVGGAIYMNAGAHGRSTSDALASIDYVNEEGILQHCKAAQMQFSYRTSPFQKMKGVIIAATFAFTYSDDAPVKQRELLDHRLRTQPFHEKSAGCIFRNFNDVSAGELIDRCGLKGVQIGGAQVSSKHANFLVNVGNATAKDMQQLIAFVQVNVREKTGYTLEQELCTL